MQPAQVADANYTDEAFEGALLVAAFIRDVHLIRKVLVELKPGDPDDG